MDAIRRVRDLPPTVLASIIAYLIELDAADEIDISVERLNEIDCTVEAEVRWEGSKMKLSTVDIDTDATDAIGDQFPVVEGTDLGKGM